MAKERYMYGTVLCQKNSDGEKYFINLKTGDKVTVSEPYKHSAKIVLNHCLDLRELACISSGIISPAIQTISQGSISGK